jgi:hypothetical protein
MHAAVSVNEGWSLGGTSIRSKKSGMWSAAGAHAYNMFVHASTLGVVGGLIRGWGALGWCTLAASRRLDRFAWCTGLSARVGGAPEIGLSGLDDRPPDQSSWVINNVAIYIFVACHKESCHQEHVKRRDGCTEQTQPALFFFKSVRLFKLNTHQTWMCVLAPAFLQTCWVSGLEIITSLKH